MRREWRTRRLLLRQPSKSGSAASQIEHNTYSAARPADAPGARTGTASIHVERPIAVSRLCVTVRGERRRRKRFAKKCGRAPHAVFRSSHPPRERSRGGAFEDDTRAISRDIVRTEGLLSRVPSFSRRSPRPLFPPRQPEDRRSRGSTKLDICFDFTRGSCRRGDGIVASRTRRPPGGVIPPRPKTAGVCFDYTKGICNRGCVSPLSHPGEISEDLARPVTRERRRIKKRERFLTIDACSFSGPPAAAPPPLSVLPPPLTITRPTPRDARRFSHDAQAVAAFATTRAEARGAARPRRCRSRFRSRRRKKRRRRLRARSALPGGRASPLARSLQTRNTRNTSDLPRTRTRRVVTTQGRSRRRPRPRLRRARTGTGGRGPPSPSGGAPGSGRSRRRDARRRDARGALVPVRRVRRGSENAPFGNEIEKVVSSSSLRVFADENADRVASELLVRLGDPSYGRGVKRGVGSVPFSGLDRRFDDAGDVRGGAVGYDPRRADGVRERRRTRVGTPGPGGASGGGVAPAFAGGWEVCSEGTERPSSGTRSGRARGAGAGAGAAPVGRVGTPGLAEHLGVGSPPRSGGGGWEVCSEGRSVPLRATA